MKYELHQIVDFVNRFTSTENWTVLDKGEVIGIIPHRPAYNIAVKSGLIYTVNEADIMDDVVAYIVENSTKKKRKKK